MQSSIVFKHSLRESSLELEKQCGSANPGHVITADVSALREWSIRRETKAHHFDAAHGKRKSLLLHYIRKYGVYLHMTCPKRRHSDEGDWAHKCVVQLFSPGLAPIKEIVLEDSWPIFCAISPDERLLVIVDQDCKVVIYKLGMKKSYGSKAGVNLFQKTGVTKTSNYIPGVTSLEPPKEKAEKPKLAPKTFSLTVTQTLQIYGFEFSNVPNQVFGGISFVNEFQFIVYSLDKVFIYGCEPSPLYALQQQSSVFTSQNQESLELSATTGHDGSGADADTLQVSVDGSNTLTQQSLGTDPGNFSVLSASRRDLPFSPSQVNSRAASRAASRAPSLVPNSGHDGIGNAAKGIPKTKSGSRGGSRRGSPPGSRAPSRRASLRGMVPSGSVTPSRHGESSYGSYASSEYEYSESEYSRSGSESEFSDDTSQLSETMSAKKRKKKRAKIAEEYFYWSNYDLVSMLDLAVYFPLKISFVCKISAESNKLFVGFNNGVIRLLSYDISMLGSPDREGQRHQKPPVELFAFTAHFNTCSVKEIVVCNGADTKLSSSIYNIELLTSGDDGRLCHWGFQCTPTGAGESVNQQLIHHLFGGAASVGGGGGGGERDMSVASNASNASSRIGTQTTVATESWTVDLLGEQIVPVEFMYIDVAIPKEERTSHKKSRTVRVPMKQSMQNMQLFHAAFNPIETFQLCICTFGGMLMIFELNQTIHLLRGNMVESQQLTLANRSGIDDSVCKARIPENISRNMTWQSLTTHGTFGPASMFQDVSVEDVLRVQQTLLLLQDDNSVAMVSVESGEHLRTISVHLSGASGMDEVVPELMKKKVIDTKLNHYHVHREQVEDEAFPESSTATVLHWCDFSRNIIIGYANGNLASVYFMRPPNGHTDGRFHQTGQAGDPAATMRSNGIGGTTIPVGFPRCRKAHKSSIVFVSSYELFPAEYAGEMLNDDGVQEEDVPDLRNAKLHRAIGRNVYYLVGDKNGTISVWKTLSYASLTSPNAMPELMYFTSIHQGSILSLHTFNVPWAPIAQSHIQAAREAGADGNDFVYPRDKVLPFAHSISADAFKSKKQKEHHDYFLRMNHRKHHREEESEGEEDSAAFASAEAGASARLKPVPPSAVLMMSSCTSGLICVWNVSLEGKLELNASFNANLTDIPQPHLSANLSTLSQLSSTCLWPFVVLQTMDEVVVAPPPPVDYNKFTEDDEDDDCVFALDPRYAEMRRVERDNRRSESVLLTSNSHQVLTREKTKMSSSLHTITLCGYDNGEIRSYNIQNSTVAQGKPTVVPILSSILVSSSKITGIRMFCPDVSGTCDEEEGGTFNNQYSKTLDNCAEVVTHFCDDGDIEGNIRGLSCMAAVSSANGVIWLVRVYGNGHIDCLHRFNVNLCPRSVIVAKDQYQHHRTASSVANNSSGGAGSAHLYVTMSLLLREIMSVSNKLNYRADEDEEDGEVYNTNGSEADMVSVEEEMSVGGTVRSVKKICRTIEALAIHPANVSKILLTVNQDKYQSLPLIWRNPPAPPPQHDPLKPPTISATPTPIAPRSPVAAVPTTGDDSNGAAGTFSFASKDTGLEEEGEGDILQSMAGAQEVKFMDVVDSGMESTPPDDEFPGSSESRPKTSELNLDDDDETNRSARPSKRIDVNLATHLISSGRNSVATASPRSLASARSDVQSVTSVGSSASRRGASSQQMAKKEAAGAAGSHREAMMVELHRAKKDSALLAKFGQHSNSNSGTVTLQAAVNIVHSWLPQGGSDLGVVSEEMIWQLVELLHIGEAELLTFLDVAKIAAVVCSAIGFTIAPRQIISKTAPRARKSYSNMKRTVTKVTYNSMGERIVQKVEISKPISDGLPKAICDELRKVWALQEPRIVTMSQIKAAEPYSSPSILSAVPESFQKLINPHHVRIGALWRGSSIGRETVHKDWIEPNDNDGGFVAGSDDYWLSLRRTVRIARTIMNMRSTWQRTFLMQAKENLPFAALIRDPENVDGRGIAKVITLPQMVMKYFDRYFGSSNLHVAHQKAMCFLEACVQYAEYPLLHYMATALELISSSNNSHGGLTSGSNNAVNGALMINYLKDSHDRDRIDKEQSNWLYSELRDLLFSRNVVLLGDKVPAHDEGDEFDLDERRSGSFSVSGRGKIDSKNGLRTIIQDPTNNAQKEVHWMLLQRSDAILCADEMFRLRGRFGPRFIDAVVRQIYTLPAVTGEKTIVRSKVTNIAGAAVVNTIERDVGSELVDCEAYLELMINEFLHCQFKTENLYDDVYFRYLKINAVITATKPHEINEAPRTGMLDTGSGSRSASQGGGGGDPMARSASSSMSFSGRDSPPLGLAPQLSDSTILEGEDITRNLRKDTSPMAPPLSKMGKQMSIGSIPDEFKKENLQISLNRIDSLFKHFIVFDPQRTGCIDMDKFEEVMHYHGPFVLGYPNEAAMKALIKLCVLNYRVPMDGSLCYLDFWAILCSWLMNSYGKDPFTVDIAVDSIKNINKGMEEDHSYALVQYMGHAQCMTTAGAFWMCKDVTQKHLIKLHKAHLQHCPGAVMSPSNAVKIENEKVSLNIKTVLPAEGDWKPEETAVAEDMSRKKHHQIQRVDELVDELKGEGRLDVKPTPIPGDHPLFPLHSSTSVGNIAFDLLKVKSVGETVQNTYGAAERTLPVDGGEWRRQMTGGGTCTLEGGSPNKKEPGYVAAVYHTERNLKTMFGETVKPITRSHVKLAVVDDEVNEEEEENLDNLMAITTSIGKLEGTAAGGTGKSSKITRTKSNSSKDVLAMTDNTAAIMDQVDERPPLMVLDMMSSVSIPAIPEPTMKRQKKGSKSTGQIEITKPPHVDNTAISAQQQAVAQAASEDYAQYLSRTKSEQDPGITLDMPDRPKSPLLMQAAAATDAPAAKSPDAFRLMESESAPMLGGLKRAMSEIIKQSPASTLLAPKPVKVKPHDSSSQTHIPFGSSGSVGRADSASSGSGFAGGFGRSSVGDLKEDSLNNSTSPSLSKYGPTVEEGERVDSAVGNFMSNFDMQFKPVAEPLGSDDDDDPHFGVKRSYTEGGPPSGSPGKSKMIKGTNSMTQKRSPFAKSYDGGLNSRTDHMIQALLTASDTVPPESRRLSISATSITEDHTPKFDNPLDQSSRKGRGMSFAGLSQPGSATHSPLASPSNANKQTNELSIKLDDDLSSAPSDGYMHADVPVHHSEFFFSPKNASASVLASYLYAHTRHGESMSPTATHPMVPGGSMHQTHRAAALVEAEKRRLQTQIHENKVKQQIFEEFELLMARRRAKLLALKMEREEMKRKERESMKKMHEADADRDKRRANYLEMERKIAELEQADKEAKEAAEAARVVAERERRNAIAEAKKAAERAEERARQERSAESTERACMGEEERTGTVIRKLRELERKAVEAERARKMAETLRENAECKQMAGEEVLMRAVLFQEWEWKRKREDWKLMRANDINIKPEIVVEEAPPEEEEEEEEEDEESENELEELEKAQAAAAEAAAAQDEGDLTHAQVMLNKFLKKVSDSDSGNGNHPRKAEAREKLKKKDDSLFFMPLDFGQDISYQPFVDESESDGMKAQSPLAMATANNTAPVSRSVSRQQRNADRTGTADSAGSRAASPTKAPLPDNENTRVLPILDDDVPSLPDTDFSFITNSVTGFKKQIEKDRASQLYQTSNSEVAPEEWTRLILKSSVNWNKYFEMDRASRLQLKLAEHIETEEERKLRLEKCFLEELSIQNDDEFDTLIDSTGIGSPKRAGSPSNLANNTSQDSLSYNETFNNAGGMTAKTISIETGIGSPSSPPAVANLSSSMSASTNKKSVMSQLPPSLVAEMKQLMVVGTKKGEFKPLPFGHIEKAVIKARGYRYFQVEVLNNDDSIVTIELKCLFGDAEIYILTDNNRHNDLSHIQSLGVDSNGVTAGTGDASLQPTRNSMLLPSSTRHEYMGKTANSENKTVRLAVHPQPRQSSGVHAQNQLGKDMPKATMKTILIAVYGATSGAMFTIWSFASSDPVPEESMARVSKYTRTFDVLSDHYTSEELFNNLPRAMHNAKLIVEREDEERISMEQMNNIFTMVTNDMEAETKASQGALNLMDGGVLRSPSEDTGSKAPMSPSGSTRRNRQDDDSVSISSSIEEAANMSALKNPAHAKLASAMQGLFNTGTIGLGKESRSGSVDEGDEYVGPTELERKEMDLDSEDIFNLESHVAKAGRSIMRRELAGNLNAYKKGPIYSLIIIFNTPRRWQRQMTVPWPGLGTAHSARACPPAPMAAIAAAPLHVHAAHLKCVMAGRNRRSLPRCPHFRPLSESRTTASADCGGTPARSGWC